MKGFVSRKLGKLRRTEAQRFISLDFIGKSLIRMIPMIPMDGENGEKSVTKMVKVLISQILEEKNWKKRLKLLRL